MQDDFSAFQCFTTSFPMVCLLHIVKWTNEVLQHSNLNRTMGTILKFFGILVLMSIFKFSKFCEFSANLPRFSHIRTPNSVK